MEPVGLSGERDYGGDVRVQSLFLDLRAGWLDASAFSLPGYLQLSLAPGRNLALQKQNLFAGGRKHVKSPEHCSPLQGFLPFFSKLWATGSSLNFHFCQALRY